MYSQRSSGVHPQASAVLYTAQLLPEVVLLLVFVVAVLVFVVAVLVVVVGLINADSEHHTFFDNHMYSLYA